MRVATLCENILGLTRYHKLVVSSFEHWRCFDVSLASGYICFLRDGFASLVEWQMSILMYHDGGYLPILVFAWTSIWMGRWSLFMSAHFVTMLNRVVLSATHFWVKLKACKWPCCGQTHSIIILLSSSGEIFTWHCTKLSHHKMG
jgi:hypothetical protein